MSPGEKLQLLSNFVDQAIWQGVRHYDPGETQICYQIPVDDWDSREQTSSFQIHRYQWFQETF